MLWKRSIIFFRGQIIETAICTRIVTKTIPFLSLATTYLSNVISYSFGKVSWENNVYKILYRIFVEHYFLGSINIFGGYINFQTSTIKISM